MEATINKDRPVIVIGSNQTIAQASVDTLGKLQAQIADLKKTERQLKNLLRMSGLEEVEGELFRATISELPCPVKVDWEALAREMLSEEALALNILRYTTMGSEPEARVSIKARKGV